MSVKLAFVGIVAATLAAPAAAAISLGPTVSGIATFTDSKTGRNWARMDTYFAASYNFMAGDLTRRGFTLATVDDLAPLLASIDVAADFNGVAAIMGKARSSRALIWGAYAPLAQNNTVDWAFASSGSGWVYGNGGLRPEDLPNEGLPTADMSFWAFTGGNAVVPEPSSWAMLIAGFGLVGTMARRRRLSAA